MSNKKSVIATDTMGASGTRGAGHLLVFFWAVVTQGFIFRIDICKIWSYSVLVFLCVSFIFMCVCVCVLKQLFFSYGNISRDGRQVWEIPGSTWKPGDFHKSQHTCEVLSYRDPTSTAVTLTCSWGCNFTYVVACNSGALAFPMQQSSTHIQLFLHHHKEFCTSPSSREDKEGFFPLREW